MAEVSHAAVRHRRIEREKREEQNRNITEPNILFFLILIGNAPVFEATGRLTH